MKIARFWALAGIPVVLAACATDEPDVEPVVVEEPAAVAPSATTAPMDTGMAGMAGMDGMAHTINLTALNNSNHTGQATLTPMGEQTQVMVQLNGTASRTHPGHIHMGTCDNLGEVVVPLDSIATDANGSGTMTTTVSVPPATVMNGQHVINYHAPDMSPVACGAIPQMAAGAM